MNPSQVSKMLRIIASKIDGSKNPSRQRVASDIQKVIYSLSNHHKTAARPPSDLPAERLQHLSAKATAVPNSVHEIIRLVKDADAEISVTDDDVREFIADSGFSSNNSSEIVNSYISDRLNISKDNALHQDLKRMKLDSLSEMITELGLNKFLKGKAFLKDGALNPEIGYKILKELFSALSNKYENAKKALGIDTGSRPIIPGARGLIDYGVQGLSELPPKMRFIPYDEDDKDE